MRGSPGTTLRALAGLTLGALAVAGCGGGTRQDVHESSGTFPVDVVKASFPLSQRLAGQSRLEITVRNPGSKAIPNVAVTVEGADGSAPGRAFAAADSQTGLADPSRPVWVLDAAPRGGDTAYVDTWALGRLRPGEQRTFTWLVTPVVSGTHTVRYRVAAGLNGKAKAQLAGGGDAAGSFKISISSKPAQARVDRNGNVVVHPVPSGESQPNVPANP